MLLHDRYENKYGESDRSYTESQNYYSYDDERFAESVYENEKSRTSEKDRDRLLVSLERTIGGRRIERQDADRYDSYAEINMPADNNFDKMWDRTHTEVKAQPSKRIGKRGLALVLTYVFLSLLAVLAITLVLANFESEKTSTVKMVSTGHNISANAEDIDTKTVSAAEGEDEKIGGEMYVMLKNGVITYVEVPASVQTTKEKEKGFDKFCSWLNSAFGG